MDALVIRSDTAGFMSKFVSSCGTRHSFYSNRGGNASTSYHRSGVGRRIHNVVKLSTRNLKDGCRKGQLEARSEHGAGFRAASSGRKERASSVSGAAQASETIPAKSSKNAKERDVINVLDRLSKVPVSNIRNFSIIAHIDHGKSTLADKLLQTTGTVEARDMKEQFLDNMDLERERGITIKLQAARMRYIGKDGDAYCLNLIDTPGHVDFTYEVSRSLAACEGALLVVDASQGVEAQTLANVYLALENNLEIIPVLNKIDLPGADPDRVAAEIEEIIGLDCTDAIRCSAKEGVGINEILESIVTKVPAPKNTAEEPLRALIFDSYFDPYRGVVVYFRVVDGKVKEGQMIQFMASGKEYIVGEVGVLSPGQMPVKELYAGEVGYLSASIRSVGDARVGDTITSSTRKASKPLPGSVGFSLSRRICNDFNRSTGPCREQIRSVADMPESFKPFNDQKETLRLCADSAVDHLAWLGVSYKPNHGSTDIRMQLSTS